MENDKPGTGNFRLGQWANGRRLSKALVSASTRQLFPQVAERSCILCSLLKELFPLETSRFVRRVARRLGQSIYVLRHGDHKGCGTGSTPTHIWRRGRFAGAHSF
jgi:hypothetical protein